MIMRISFSFLIVILLCLNFITGGIDYSLIENPNITVKYDISSRLEPQIPNIFHTIYTVTMTIENTENRTVNDILIKTSLKELVTDDTRENETFLNTMKPNEIQIRSFTFENLFPERKYSISYSVYSRTVI